MTSKPAETSRRRAEILPETVDELATRRKTARKFTRTPVNSDDIFYCIKVAIQAPSGANRQPWCFLIIDDPKLRKKLRTACEEQEKSFHGSAEDSLKQWFKSKNITWRKPHLTDAPMLLAVFSDQKMPYGTESTWLSIGYFTIALEERYLSTVTYTPPYPEDLKGLFNAPEGYKLETILPIGYSADAKPKEKRKSIGSFIYRNAWSRTTETIA